MIITSLTIKTDLIFAKQNGELRERNEYLVVRTPSNPGYHWGNFIVFDAPPAHGDDKRWPALFKEEFKDVPGVKHFAFTWNQQHAGDFTKPFLDGGFNLDSNVALATKSVSQPAKFNADVDVRPIRTDAQWEQAIQNQILANEDKYEATGFERFKRAQMANYRKMADAGLGHWFGAFLGDDLAASCGVFFEQKCARYQSVVTSPKFRRRGVCGSLVYESGRYALEHWGVNALVMVADENYHAAKIYESVGFAPVEKNFALSWYQNEYR